MFGILHSFINLHHILNPQNLTITMTPMSALHKCILIITCALLVLSANAQTPAPIIFGKVDLKDLQMKSYEKDSTASAVMLCDYGEYSFNFSDNIPRAIYRHHIRIKILNKAGFKYASRVIPYYFPNDNNRVESITKLEATTWNLENGIVVMYKLNPEEFFESKEANDIRYKKFTFPKVQEGSVLEYTYEMVSGMWYDLRKWEFQRSIPTVWSELRAEIPGYFIFNITLHSLIPLKVQESKEGKENFMRGDIRDPYLGYRFVMENIPALKEEPFVTTIEDYRSSLDFELSSTNFPNQSKVDYSKSWESLNETLLTNEYFGKQIKRFDEAEKIAVNLKNQYKSDTLALLNAAYKHVQDRMQWNDEVGVFTSKSNLDKIYEKRIGNAAEINLILIRLLRECGFDANPFILSTRDNGQLSDLVLLNKFNYTIAHILLNGKDVLLDATSKLTPIELLPLNCLNDRGRLIVRKNSRWIKIPANISSRKVTLANMSILPNQQLKGTINISFTAHNALTFRKNVLERGEAAYISDYKKEHGEHIIEKINLINVDSLENIPQLDIHTTLNEAYSELGERIYFTPTLGLAISEQPFKSPNRAYPIDFTVLQEETFSANFTIPDGYMIEEMPKNESITLPKQGGRFDFRVEVLDNIIRIQSKISLKKVVYMSDEYLALREFYNRIILKNAEQVVLKKK
jgi:Domain of Unknown Function with PDB structure (DUF3857)